MGRLRQLSLICILAAALFACNDNETANKSTDLPQDRAQPENRQNPEKADMANAEAVQQKTDVQSGNSANASDPDTPALEQQAAMDPALADRIMAFSNSAQRKLDEDWRKTAEMYYNLAHIYLKVYNLPANVTQPKRNRLDLVPPEGLFSPDEEKILFKSMDNMDKALASMLTHYRNLEKYILDNSIKDNGRQGRVIVRELEQDHKSFMKANISWLEILNKKAMQAEAVILKDHPLARQAMAGSAIMTLIAEVRDLTAGSETDRNALAAIADKIGQLIQTGEKPPFPAASAIERLFRIFLKNAAIYNDVLKRTALEGIFDIQKRELALAARVCRETYNDFVLAFNELI